MAINYTLGLLFGVSSLALYSVLSYIYNAYQRSVKAKKWGCEPPPEGPDHGFLGLKLLKRVQAADKEWVITDFMMKRHKELNEHFGRVVTTSSLNMLGSTFINTNDPKNIQALLATQFEDFGLGPTRRANMMTLLGDGIFVQDGKAWEHSRAMLRPNFVRDQVSDLNLEEKHLQNLLQAIKPSSVRPGWTEETDLQTLFFRLTLDSATEFLFGESVDSQIREAEEKTISNKQKNITDESFFAKAFDDGQRHLARRFRFGNYYWLHNPKEFKSACAETHAFVDTFVKRALEATASDSPPSEKNLESGQKQRYVFSESLAKQTKDPIEIRAQLLNILLAGRDTTASLLSYLFHHLVRHQEEWTNLRAAILDDFGTYNDPRNLTFATLKSCTYLTWCINETLRLTTVVPGNGRTALRDTTIPRGGGPNGDKPVFIRKGQGVEYSIHVMHRRKDLWGEDAEEWKPSRWDGKRPGWEFLPFNGGPRICIGQQFALVEASYVTVRLLQRFSAIEAAADELTRKVTANVTLTACPGKGPIVRLKLANE